MKNLLYYFVGGAGVLLAVLFSVMKSKARKLSKQVESLKKENALLEKAKAVGEIKADADKTAKDGVYSEAIKVISQTGDNARLHDSLMADAKGAKSVEDAVQLAQRQVQIDKERNQ